MLDLELVTPPAEPALSRTAAKAQLRVDHADQDDLIDDLIASAVGRLDGYSGVLGRALVAQTWALHLTCFPVGSIRLPLPPLISVTSVAYVDAAGATQTVSSDSYIVHAGGLALVEPAPGCSWPHARLQHRAVTVTFICGYGSADAVPKPLQSALRLLVEAEFDGEIEALSDAVKNLIAPFRVART